MVVLAKVRTCTCPHAHARARAHTHTHIHTHRSTHRCDLSVVAMERSTDLYYIFGGLASRGMCPLVAARNIRGVHEHWHVPACGLGMHFTARVGCSVLCALQMAFQGTMHLTDRHLCFSVEERGKQLPIKVPLSSISSATRQLPAQKGGQHVWLVPWGARYHGLC